MKNIVLAAVLLLSLIFIVGAHSVSRGSDNLKNDISLLFDKCGYALDDDILNEISQSYSRVGDRIISFNFYVSLKPADRPIRGTLSFGCFAPGSAPSKPSVAQRLTAAEEISRSDSSGRYVRNIVWQRKYVGNGWSGTIAYTNSVFGDLERLSIPDYFLVCPDKQKLACFSFEVERDKLEKKESDRIPALLHGISILNSQKSF